MQKSGDFKITKIDRMVIRPGFPGRSHCVTFKCPAHNAPVDSFFQVWVPVAYPEAEVERVARTFLSQRMLELAELAKASALADAAIDALRKGHSGDRSVRTDKLARRSSL